MVAQPPALSDTAAWTRLVATRCLDVARVYLGGRVPEGIRAAWIPIESKSWLAGRRVVECLGGHYTPSGTEETVTGTLRG